MATSCDLNAPRCTTTVPQVRLHGSRGGVFVGHRPPRDPGDPLQDKKFYIYSDGTHTQPHRGGADEMKMKVRWQWKWNEHYLTRTRRGERKRRGTERTPTRHTWPETGQTLKRQGKRKAEGRRTTEQDQRRGGKDGSAWTNLTRRKTYAYLGTRRTQPTWREENAGTHEKRGPMGN